MGERRRCLFTFSHRKELFHTAVLPGFGRALVHTPFGEKRRQNLSSYSPFFPFILIREMSNANRSVSRRCTEIQMKGLFRLKCVPPFFPYSFQCCSERSRSLGCRRFCCESTHLPKVRRRGRGRGSRGGVVGEKESESRRKIVERSFSCTHRFSFRIDKWRTMIDVSLQSE